MSTIRLCCSSAGTLFYEPNGLLLRSCLVPTDNRHSEHLLTFQLGYLGPGDIAVHIALRGGPTDSRPQPEQPPIDTVLLHGTEAFDDIIDTTGGRLPNAWLTYVPVPVAQVAYRYVVWGQPGGGEDDLRGELVVDISGCLPLLTATTRAGVTRTPLPDRLRSQAAFEWNQESGRGNFPLPSCAEPVADTCGSCR